MSRILVCYLVPPGEEYLQSAGRFFESYRHHVAGIKHDRCIILKGEAEYDPDGWVVIRHPNDGQDIRSLQLIARDYPWYDYIMWFGANSRVAASHWLSKFKYAMFLPWVGAASSAGSYECGVSGKKRNPHICTRALMISPRLLNAFNFPLADTHVDRYEFEHGNSSLYNRILDRGLAGVVVGASGQIYYEHEWPTSRTFRYGDQSEAMVADNHTDAFDAASPDERLVLARMAGWEPE